MKKVFWDPHPNNVKMVLESIRETDIVLDIGGWWKPFSRANYVVDYLPFETRGGGGHIGEQVERFNSSSWFQMDICSQTLPFADKEVDFVFCGQTLEDVRDPLWVCQEMIRVGKHGYIEVPSIWIECQYGIDALDITQFYPGYEKHRWLVLFEENKVIFIPKLVWLSHYKFVPDDLADRYKSDQAIWTSHLMWNDTFQYEELIFAGRDVILPILEQYFAHFDFSHYRTDTNT